MTDYTAEEVPQSGVGLSDQQLMVIVGAEIDRAKSYSLGQIGKERAVAYDYYYGRPYGDEQVGRSQVISRDVAEQVDSAVPGMVKIFGGTDRAVEFTARKAEDVQGAEQATELCNYIFYSQNPGFLLIHDAVKNAFLQKTACFKWYWDESVSVSEETYEGLNAEEMTILLDDPMVEPLEQSPGEPVMVPMPGQPGQPPQFQTIETYNVKVRKKTKAGQVRICVVPPDELLVSESCYGMNADDLPAITHRSKKTLSDLVEMGYDKDEVLAMTGDDDGDFTYEAESRRSRTGDWQNTEKAADPMMREIWYNETYIKVDFDGDGIAERRKICSVGTSLLHNEMVDSVPMSFGTFKIMPGEFFGVSMADEVMDLQLLKSTLWRRSMDSLYLSITPRVTVDTTRITNLDDVMTVRIGGVIRSNGPAGDAVVPMAVPFVGQQTFPMIEYIDSECETRTGVSRLMQGIDPNTLNKTATGVNTLMNAAQERLGLVARGLAETLVKPMFRGIMKLLAEHQHEALTIRLRNQYVAIDPRTWTTDYDMTINVGLGVGSKDQQLMHLQSMEQAQAGLAQSPFGRLIDEAKIFNLQQKKSELAGFKDATQFFNDPKSLPPPQPPPPPPEVQKAQAAIQAQQQKQQSDMQMAQQKMAMDQQNKQREMAADMALERQKMMMEMQLEEFKARLDAMVKERTAMLHPPMPHLPQ